MKKFSYKKKQAFNKVYKEVVKSPLQDQSEGFVAAKKYYPDPDRLIFNTFTQYFDWAGELYKVSTEAGSYLEGVYNRVDRASSSYFKFETERKLFDIIRSLDEIQVDLNNLRNDIKVFQGCMLATHINEKSAEIEILSDELRNLTLLEEKVRETINRKLFEISTMRMSFYTLLISITAIVISLKLDIFFFV